MTDAITRYLDLMDHQRLETFGRLGRIPDAVLWYRPEPKVWSIGGHLDHTRVINCFTRRLMIAYFPFASIFAAHVSPSTVRGRDRQRLSASGFPDECGLDLAAQEHPTATGWREFSGGGALLSWS